MESDIERIFQLETEGDLESISEFSPSELARCTDKNGSTLLHYACGSNNNLDMVKFFLNCGFEAEQPNEQGRNTLHWAARHGATHICLYLVTEIGVKVDSMAKGQVTPLQLAVWQCHLTTAKCLVEELGANPHFPNFWGCTIGHWLGKSPVYDGSEASKTKLQDACDWLFGHCRVEYNLPNNHGQCPLHKAAYAGNLIVAQVLVETYGVIDSTRDHSGNSAADCAERTGESPSLFEIRRSYIELAKKHHPDKALISDIGDTDGMIARWNEIQQSFRLLKSWWEDPPEVFDLHIRLASRNAKLQEYEKLCWTPTWHEEQMRQEEPSIPHSNINLSAVNSRDNTESLKDFEARLVRLLSSGPVPLSNLSKEYEKCWHIPIPKPREFGCRKLSYLLETKCPRIEVDKTGGSQEPVVRVANLTVLKS